MIAVDTNILVHAHHADSDLHALAKHAVTELAESGQPWAVPIHCVVEFYGIVTHRGIWRIPSTPAQAVDQINAWHESPTLRLLGDQANVVARLLELVLRAQVAGPKIHDARIAAVCQSHGVRELWTVDRDFSSFPSLRTRNPLV